jgi:polysaccharide export outer membrane protein
MPVRLLAIVLFSILMLEQVALSQNMPLAQANEDRPGTSVIETLIGGGDLLRVSVFGVKDFDVDARVSARGSVSLPLIGDVQVGGLTTDEAQAVIEKRLIDGQFMLHPEVSVFAKEYATQGVSVMGEVQKPGIYPMLGSHGLFDVLSMAGGTTPKSGTTVTITHRSRPHDPVQVKLVDVGKSPDANSEILPGDTVFVSKAGIVYVVGDVKNPSGIAIENDFDMTVLKAIAIAGGVNPTAAVSSAKLIRRTSNGPEETSIPLKKILSAKVTDLKLQPEDIIFVPNSAAKSVGRRGLEAALQAATGIAIYRTP